MKKSVKIFVTSLVVALSMVSCSKKEEGPQKWEYKIVEEWGVGRGNFMSKGIPLPEAKMNQLGDEGWELVDVYTRIETVHPNFGDEKYVTGLQPNTRTEAVFFVFKRPINKGTQEDKKEETTESDAVVEEVEVVEVVEAVADTCSF